MDYKLPKDYKLPDYYTNYGYISPIGIYQANIEPDLQGMLQSTKEQIENYILAQIKMAVNVDKEELIKALKYDRNQYDKGYQNAKAEYDRGHGHWIISFDNPYNRKQCFCSVCGRKSSVAGINQEVPYCHWCGAQMDEEEEVE